MKQTAVEWLVKELNQIIDFIPMEKWEMIRDTVQQAKAMEKEQITDAWKDGAVPDEDLTMFAEKYYSETFEKNNNSNSKLNKTK
jgi:hypothetical protein